MATPRERLVALEKRRANEQRKRLGKVLRVMKRQGIDFGAQPYLSEEGTTEARIVIVFLPQT